MIVEALPIWQLTILRTTHLITDLLIALNSIVLLTKFAKLPEKIFGLYMMAFLLIIDLTFPLMTMLTAIFTVQDKVYLIFGVSIYRFSLYWSTAIAIFTYLILVKGKTVVKKAFTNRALMCCSVLSLLCPLM